MTKDKIILWSPILVILILSLVLLWWDHNERQAHELDALMENWSFEHCTPTNKHCGRLE